MRRSSSKRAAGRGAAAVDYELLSTDRLKSSRGWDIVNDGSSSDGSDVDRDGGVGGSGDIYSFLFGPLSSSATPTAATATATERRGRGGYSRLARDHISGLGLDIAGNTGMGSIDSYLPLDLSYLAGLTGWSQQRSNNADGWDDDDDSNASRYCRRKPHSIHSTSHRII